MAGRSLHLEIFGRVQGVGFRWWTKQKAEALGLSGWVRNRADGSVEAVISGPSATVGKMLEKCGKGPPFARVDDIRSNPCDAPQNPGFETLPTI